MSGNGIETEPQFVEHSHGNEGRVKTGSRWCESTSPALISRRAKSQADFDWWKRPRFWWFARSAMKEVFTVILFVFCSYFIFTVLTRGKASVTLSLCRHLNWLRRSSDERKEKSRSGAKENYARGPGSNPYWTRTHIYSAEQQTQK
jgi:hypothetical protein